MDERGAGSKGRPKVSDEVHLGLQITKTEIEGIFARLLRMPFSQLETFIKDKEATVHDLVVGRIIYEAIRKGDPRRLDFLYDRLIGKSKDPNADSNVVHNLNRMIVLAMERNALAGAREVPALQEPGDDGASE